jgi:hypothetical protein
MGGFKLPEAQGPCAVGFPNHQRRGFLPKTASADNRIDNGLILKERVLKSAGEAGRVGEAFHTTELCPSSPLIAIAPFRYLWEPSSQLRREKFLLGFPPPDHSSFPHHSRLVQYDHGLLEVLEIRLTHHRALALARRFPRERR